MDGSARTLPPLDTPCWVPANSWPFPRAWGTHRCHRFVLGHMGLSVVLIPHLIQGSMEWRASWLGPLILCQLRSQSIKPRPATRGYSTRILYPLLTGSGPPPIRLGDDHPRPESPILRWERVTTYILFLPPNRVGSEADRNIRIPFQMSIFIGGG